MDVKFLERKIQNFIKADDVFRLEFLQGVVFCVTSAEKMQGLVTAEASALLQSLGNEWLETQVVCGIMERPVAQAGVYLTLQTQSFEVYRIFDDHQGAFLTPLIPGQNEYLSIPSMSNDSLTSRRDHHHLSITSSDLGAGAVAVPSRLRSQGVGKSALAGLRIAVKDNFYIKGIRTSLCSRAYYDLYPPATKTAKCITLLESAGAQIVGTTKLATFAATEEPLECVDYQAPWNPRGDGHQSPAGSSSGSGVAIASYEWLDISVGSDSKFIPPAPRPAPLTVPSKR